MRKVAGVRRRPNSERQHRSAVVAERRGPAGVEEQGTFIAGSSRNLGGPVVSVKETGFGDPVNNPRPAAVAPCGRGSEVQGALAVPRSEETKQRGRDGRKSECFIVCAEQ